MPIDFTAIDPNILYLSLVAGLWIGVTALYLPGTWIPEILSLLLLVFSFVALGSLATAWWAVALVALGISTFLILPFFDEKYGRFAEIGLIAQAVGSPFIFKDQSISLLLIVATIVIAILYNRFVLVPTIKNQRRFNEYDASNQVMGIRGRVVKDLDPVGTVYVNKELWRARSEEYLTRDTPVVVVGQEGLELIVEKSKNQDIPQYDEAQKRASMN